MRSALSLHLRLTGLLVILVVVLFGVIFIYAEVRSQELASRDVEDQLRVGAVLTLRATTGPANSGQPALPNFETSEIKSTDGVIVPAYELADVDGHIIVRSFDFPTDMDDTADGYSDPIADGQRWRVLTVQNADRRLIGRVAIKALEEERRANTIRSDLIMPLLVALILLAITVLAAIWIGLRPLRRIEKEISDIDPVRMAHLKIAPETMPRELARLTRTVNDLLDRLQKLLRHQKAFIAAAGHELRTPLAGCTTQLEVARRATDPSDKEHALERLDEGLHRMESLVRQLLIIARSEQSRLDLTRAPLDLSGLLKAIVDDLPPERAKVTLSMAPSPVCISGHPDLIGSMIGNLIENAARVSPAGEAVEIWLDRDENTARISVCDQGPGLSEEQKSKVLDSFYSGADGKGPGTGLGLAIVQAVVAAHRGTVRFIDRVPTGLCVEITLPIAPSPHPLNAHS